MYQSDALKRYISSDNFNPFKDRVGLLKAILWTADLKRICLEVDPEESRGGSNIILRGAHDISDRLEEESKLTMSHGEAVLKAMKIDLKDSNKIESLDYIYEKLGIGYY